MLRGAIPYRGGWLAPGSQAHRLHTEGKLKELESHMREVDRRARALQGDARDPISTYYEDRANSGLAALAR